MNHSVVMAIRNFANSITCLYNELVDNRPQKLNHLYPVREITVSFACSSFDDNVFPNRYTRADQFTNIQFLPATEAKHRGQFHQGECIYYRQENHFWGTDARGVSKSGQSKHEIGTDIITLYSSTPPPPKNVAIFKILLIILMMNMCTYFQCAYYVIFFLRLQLCLKKIDNHTNS